MKILYLFIILFLTTISSVSAFHVYGYVYAGFNSSMPPINGTYIETTCWHLDMTTARVGTTNTTGGYDNYFEPEDCVTNDYVQSCIDGVSTQCNTRTRYTTSILPFNIYTTCAYPANYNTLCIVNITLYDELTGKVLNQSADVKLSSETNQTTYSINGSALRNITYTNYSVYVNSSGSTNYDSRYYYINNEIRNGLFKIYLTKNASSVLFTLRDSGTALPISEASISMYVFLNNTWSLVESKLSDVTGKAIFNYYPLVNYKFYISATGYNNNLYDLDPILFSNYVVLMVRNQTPIGQNQTQPSIFLI
jgi:hypothetical protein